MFRQRGETETIWIEPEKESVETQRARAERLIPVDIGTVVDVAEQGPTLKDGSHNFDCSCMGSLPYGPCGRLYRNVMNCMLKNESSDQLEQCAFSRMVWGACMDEHWKIYYPIAANVKSRQE